MTWRVRYRDRRRPWTGQCLVRLTAINARRAAALARAQLEARGVHPVILGVSPAN
jgi:hypothetical protein